MDYKLDSILVEYILNFTPHNLDKIELLFNNIVILNKSSLLSRTLNINVLEDELLKITEIDYTEVDININDAIVGTINKNIVKYLAINGMNLSPEISLTAICEIFRVLNILADIDRSNSEDINDVINDVELSNITKFTNIITEYSTLTEAYLLSNIIDIDIMLFINIVKHIQNKPLDIDADNIDVVIDLTKIDDEFTNTIIVKEILEKGYTDNNVNTYLPYTMSNISTMTDNNRIAYEFVATLYLGMDTRPNLKDGVRYFNKDILDPKLQTGENIAIILDTINSIIDNIEANND